MIQFVLVGEEVEINFPFIIDSLYAGAIDLIIDMGPARGFMKTEKANSKITIKPGKSHVGEYKVKVTVTDGKQAYTKTMHLNVKNDDETVDIEDNEESVESVESTNEAKELFVTQNDSDLAVNIDSKLVLVVDDFITQGIGTRFDKVELLELGEFAYFSNNRITIAPK